MQLYNGINDHLFTVDGVFDAKGKQLAFTVESNSKIKVGKADPDFVTPPDYHKWALFLKCVRGDPGDNVFSAYPGVREKGSKNKVGLIEAYADRTKQGFNWNNMMLQRWVDHNGEEHRVRDCYERNRTLIDLTAQPQDVKDKVDNAIRSGVRVTTTPQVGIHFMKFCGKYELNKISEQAEAYAKWLNNPYQGSLT